MISAQFRKRLYTACVALQRSYDTVRINPRYYMFSLEVVGDEQAWVLKANEPHFNDKENRVTKEAPMRTSWDIVTEAGDALEAEWPEWLQATQKSGFSPNTSEDKLFENFIGEILLARFTGSG